jgi:hypothetical protein
VQHPDPAWQIPPQPLLAPQSLPAQFAVQHPDPAWQIPPQPLLAPQSLLAQFGVQAPKSILCWLSVEL